MLKYRLIFGPIMALAAVLIFWFDHSLDTIALPQALRPFFLGRQYPPPGIPLLILGLIIIPLAARELVAILKANEIKAHAWVIMIGSILAGATIYSTPTALTAATGVSILSSVLVVSFMATLIWHARHSELKGVVASAGGTLFGVIYLGILLGFLLGIRRWHTAWVLVSVILITKSCDIGGYTFGRLFGKHKLIPWLSPGKTWEGLAGGVFFCALAGLLFAGLSNWTDMAMSIRTTYSEGAVSLGNGLYGMPHRYTWYAGIILGVILGLVGQVGDLTVSAFKRDAGLKDSGKSIPGFGGLLDVLDSPLLVAPVAYWLLEPMSHL